MLKRLGRHGYVLSFGVIAASLAGVGFSQGEPLLWAGSLGLGFGLGAVQIATLTRYARLGDRAGHGKVSGMSALVGPSGGVLGNLVGAGLNQWLSLPHVFLLLAAAFGIVAGLALLRPADAIEPTAPLAS